MLRNMKLVVALGAMMVLGVTGLARADALGPINFESGYTAGNINNQHGWSNTGGFDAAVANVSGFPAAASYGFGSKALRISDAVTSGSFGDQTFSPGLANEAGETSADSGGTPVGTRQKHFEVSFQIGTTQSTEQPGLHMSMSPDRGDGARMSYLRFDDLSNGVHVYFDDVTNSGPLGAPADFNERSIATLSRSSAHTIRMTIDFNDGPGQRRRQGVRRRHAGRHGWQLGGLLPLRSGAGRRRQQRADGRQGPLPGERRRRRGQRRSGIPDRQHRPHLIADADHPRRWHRRWRRSRRRGRSDRKEVQEAPQEARRAAAQGCRGTRSTTEPQGKRRAPGPLGPAPSSPHLSSLWPV